MLREYCRMWQWNNCWALSTKAYYCQRCLANTPDGQCAHKEHYVCGIKPTKPHSAESIFSSIDLDKEADE